MEHPWDRKAQGHGKVDTVPGMGRVRVVSDKGKGNTVVAADKEEIWDTLDTMDKADRFWAEGEVDKEAVWDRERTVDRMDTAVEVDRSAEDREEGKDKVHTAVVADILSAVDIRDTSVRLDTWVEAVEEVADRVAHTWVVWVSWAAVEVAAEQGSWDISEASVVSEAEDTSDSIFSVADIPWALPPREAWSKGVDMVSEAANTWSSLDVDDKTLKQTECKVSVVVRKILSVESVSYSRGLTWRNSPTVEKGVVASSSVLSPLR